MAPMLLSPGATLTPGMEGPPCSAALPRKGLAPGSLRGSLPGVQAHREGKRWIFLELLHLPPNSRLRNDRTPPDF